MIRRESRSGMVHLMNEEVGNGTERYFVVGG